MIKRELAQTILKQQKPGFITIIYGPRRVGKTVLVGELEKELRIAVEQTLKFDADTKEARDALSTTSEMQLSRLMTGKKLIIIDEAQRIANIGLSLKILIDRFPEKIFIVTGSSSLDLAAGLQEPLTGRSKKYKLYPLSTRELTGSLEAYKKSAILEDQLLFGGYPYLTQLTTQEEKKQYLTSIIDDYLFRDVFALENISSRENFRKLATLLAFQIGSEVSLNELSSMLGIDVKTVGRYLSLLQQSFVIFELSAFAKNLRNEVTKSKKYYFWDTGIRNAIINQFLPLDSRTDVGKLWENFLAIERLKRDEYLALRKNYYFWRTYQGREIDWIEVDEKGIAAFEFKYKGKKVSTPAAFLQTYKTFVSLVSSDNYFDFI